MAAKPTRRCCFTIAIATAIGFLAFASPSLADTGSVYVDGNSNVGAGHDFFGGTTPIGFNNVGLGYSVMSHLTTGNDNVATGDFALYENTIGNRNLALGSSALAANTTGVRNGAAGFQALLSNTTGTDNLASGTDALDNNTTGDNNLASGTNALKSNTTANDNIASGYRTLTFNTTGADNTASGFQALLNNTTGNSNVALGSGAGNRLTTGSNNVDIANRGVAGESGKIRIGSGSQDAAFIAGISGASVPGSARPVLVNASGKLGTATAAASAKTSGAKPLSAAAGKRLLAEVRSLQRQNRRQGKEIRALRAQTG